MQSNIGGREGALYPYRSYHFSITLYVILTVWELTVLQHTGQKYWKFSFPVLEKKKMEQG